MAAILHDSLATTEQATSHTHTDTEFAYDFAPFRRANPTKRVHTASVFTGPGGGPAITADAMTSSAAAGTMALAVH